MTSSPVLRLPGGVLDTCVVIYLSRLPDAALPISATVATVTLAELSAGVSATKDPVERSKRITRLLAAEANFDPLPFDANAAHAYGNLVALTLEIGRDPRPRRNDLMIAATAVVNNLPLYTANIDDFRGLDAMLTVVPVAVPT